MDLWIRFILNGLAPSGQGNLSQRKKASITPKLTALSTGPLAGIEISTKGCSLEKVDSTIAVMSRVSRNVSFFKGVKSRNIIQIKEIII